MKLKLDCQTIQHGRGGFRGDVSARCAKKTKICDYVGLTRLRSLMAEAVARYQADLERVSFKGTLDALRQYSTAIACAPNCKLREALWDDLLLNLVRDLVPNRPDRLEPRSLKRRPKNFGWLTKPRRLFQESFHRNRYWTSKPRNYRGLN